MFSKVLVRGELFAREKCMHGGRGAGREGGRVRS